MSFEARTTLLNNNWRWKQRNFSVPSVFDELRASDWNDVSSMPSEIHVELMHVGRIPDPFLEFNEHQVQWVGEREWLYSTTFTVSDLNAPHMELIFEGLDTFCSIYLNGNVMLHTNNMFLSYTLSLDNDIVRGDNTLLLHFVSAKHRALELERQYGKAQYAWRWDWGPELMSVGPYRPISLRLYKMRLSDVHARTSVSVELVPSLTVDVSLAGDLNDAHAIATRLLDHRGVNCASANVDISNLDRKRQLSKLVEWTFTSNKISLWWPVGYGEQTLYSFETVLLDKDGNRLDINTQAIGFRRVRLIQEPLQKPDQYGKGTTFLFEVNNVRMFIGGSNWIPADSFLTRISADLYRRWLQLLKDGNQNMVRLWGGGVYEPDVFYDICDELGILVWQDFQFACGVYPVHDDFLASVQKEAEANVMRLRRHPCMALWCGNNEDYQQVFQWDLQGDNPLPAVKIYEEILPDVVSRLTHLEVPYHRGSPYGGESWNTADPTVGDVHQWDVWAGKGDFYQNYDILGGRFVSEFGVPAFPAMATIKQWLNGNEEDEYAQSKLMQQHNKAGSHERRFAVLMNENFRITEDFERYVYQTKIMQSEAVSYAYRMWRRGWKGRGKEYTSGAIVWQLNDCWPAISWAIVDYFLRPKPAYYTIARELQPFTVGILRLVTKNRETDRPRQFYEFGAFQATHAVLEVWATNSTLTSKSVTLEMCYFDTASEWTTSFSYDVQLEANQSTEILKIACPIPGSSQTPVGQHVVGATPTYTVIASARLVDTSTGLILSRNVDWPQPFRHTKFRASDVHIRRDADDAEMLYVSSDVPVKGVVLGSANDDSVRWSDNALDLIPGDEQVIRATGLDSGGIISITHMGGKSMYEPL